MHLFWASGSPFSWRVQLALEYKALSYESHLLQFSRGDLKTSEFLAMNPRGKVPVLRDGDTVVAESIAILAYLDRKYPEPPLFGATAEHGAAVWQAVQDIVVYLEEPSERFILPLYRGALGGPSVEAKVREALDAVVPEWNRIEARLSSQPYLAGATLSAADFVAYPGVKSLLRAAGKPDAARLPIPFTPVAERAPAITAWMNRIEALPYYERTYPPHWR